MDEPRPTASLDEEKVKEMEVDRLKPLLTPLEPDSRTVRRVVAAAVAERSAGSADPAAPGRPQPRPWGWLAAAVVAVALLGAMLATILGRHGAPSNHPATAPLPPPPSVATLTITNKNGPVTIQTPAGAQLVVLSGGHDAQEDRP